jgi:integrase
MWGWLNTNPVTAFSKRRLRESRPRTRFLDQAEYAALLSVASDRLRSAIVLAVETGLRKEELFGLKVSDIDLRRREIVLEYTKTGAPRRAPLTDAAIAEIGRILSDKQRPRGAAHLFCHPDGTRVGDYKKAFLTACKRAAINNLHWHDLRHTFASWYLQAGGDMYALSRILGHTTLQMTARYSHLRTEDLHRAIQSVAQKRSQDHLIATGAAQDADITI